MLSTQLIRFSSLLRVAFLTPVLTLALFGGSALAQSPEDDARAGVGGGNAAGVTNVASTVADILTLAVGALAVIFIIIGGFKYITSAGDASKSASARSTILYSVVGLVVVIFARVIVNFVLDEAEADAAMLLNLFV